MEITFPHAGNFEVFHRLHQREEVTGVVAAGACRMCLQVHRPLLPREALRKVSHKILEFRLERFCHLVTNFRLDGSFFLTHVVLLRRSRGSAKCYNESSRRWWNEKKRRRITFWLNEL